MENISVIAALRSSRMVGGKAPIIIRIIIGRSVAKTLNTGIKIPPAAWDPVSRLVLKTEPNCSVFNMKLKKEVSKLEGEFAAKSVIGISITRAQAKKIAEGKDPGRDFYEFCREWILLKYDNKETLRTYFSEITKMKRFKAEMAFGDIDLKVSYKLSALHESNT